MSHILENTLLTLHTTTNDNVNDVIVSTNERARYLMLQPLYSSDADLQTTSEIHVVMYPVRFAAQTAVAVEQFQTSSCVFQKLHVSQGTIIVCLIDSI